MAGLCASFLLSAQYRGGGGDGAIVASASSAVAPLDLLDFSARPEGAFVRLNWRTANERQTRQFTVERSPDGRSFTPIGTVAAAGNSVDRELHYTFRDSRSPEAKSYYRLLMEDTDGRFRYSDVVTVQLSATSATVDIYPNPNAGSSLHLALPGAYAGQGFNVEIIDATGRQLLFRQTIHPEAGPARIDFPNRLAAGSYLVRVHSARQILPARILIVTE
ncbi:putative secreted protein (Por secretion system target) [Neolewinella xylanilytica]|uniref:Putative secreted protein (Por secretion system target) n=2 Tax=Neolewinella xylanilytica TaxID=1514080 RepID=A0A2S6I9N1_9BACT|nr:putative secreted protein (Por secretion system target) [Neolewinella xylanilytica]